MRYNTQIWHFMNIIYVSLIFPREDMYKSIGIWNQVCIVCNETALIIDQRY